MDRNNLGARLIVTVKRSLSARRAWIEIEMPTQEEIEESVALRKESVDRNRVYAMIITICTVLSLSARRAWIEIVVGRSEGGWLSSLSARRAWIEIVILII